jgi:hypothetical protein
MVFPPERSSHVHEAGQTLDRRCLSGMDGIAVNYVGHVDSSFGPQWGLGLGTLTGEVKRRVAGSKRKSGGERVAGQRPKGQLVESNRLQKKLETAS